MENAGTPIEDADGGGLQSTQVNSTVTPTELDVNEVKELRTRAQELEESEPDKPRRTAAMSSEDSGVVAGLKPLQSMLDATLFGDYLHYRAMNAHNLPAREHRVSAYCENHRALAFVCTALDVTTRLLVWVAVYSALVAIVGAAIWRTFLEAIFIS
ncbi:hypothetical protein [Tomitella cavernea]|uniref:Uncharacterized protein n=1 Tax=Tomitella cavernea TaxID=1387982 RepID=A0ABP9CIN0_9ACTN|nr:hypothetical protein [Tomitella cavernea]